MTITRASNRLLQEMDFDEWCHQGDLLIEDHENAQWEIGHWWNTQPAYGPRVKHGEYQFKLEIGTLRDYGWIAAKFQDVSFRNDTLPAWWKCRAVASLIPDHRTEAFDLLDRAGKENWKRKQLKKEVWQVKLDLGLVQPKFEKAKLVPPMPRERELTPPQFLEKTLSEISKYLNPDRDKKVVDMVNLVLSFKDDDLHQATRKDAARTVRRVAQRFLDLAARLDPEDQEPQNNPLVLEDYSEKDYEAYKIN